MRVTVTIASSGRATLTRTLESLCEMYLPPDVAVDIVIADDSRNGLVRRVVEAGSPWPLAVRCLAVGAGNVSLARNACLDAAAGDLIAFIDDDEWVARDWLVRMLTALDELKADCVFGPVYPLYPDGTPDWIKRANPLFTDWGPRGGVVELGRSGNTLVRRHVIERQRLRFDHRLGRNGGEDTDFFWRLGRAGARMVVTDDAHVFEAAPPERVNVPHFRARALRKGQNYARFRASRPGTRLISRLGLYGGAMVKAAAGLSGARALSCFDRAAGLRLAMRGWMNLGKLRELAGLEPPRWS